MPERLQNDLSEKLVENKIPLALQMPNEGYWTSQKMMEDFLKNVTDKKELDYTSGVNIDTNKIMVRLSDGSVAIVERITLGDQAKERGEEFSYRAFPVPRETWDNPPTPDSIVNLNKQNETVAEFYRKEQTDKFESGKFKLYFYSSNGGPGSSLPAASFYTGINNKPRTSNGWNAQFGWNKDMATVEVVHLGEGKFKVVAEIDGALTKDDIEANRGQIIRDMVNLWKNYNQGGYRYSDRKAAEDVMTSDWEIISKQDSER